MKTSEFKKEIKGNSLEELREKARAFSEELMKLRFRKSSGQLEQAHRLGELKRNLARVNTLIVAKSKGNN